jgi:tetratricopeptide (TPR) repeat protein
MNKFYYLLIFPLFIFFACKTASKAYDKGNYQQAIELAVKKLQKDPSDGEAIAIVQSSYKHVAAVHNDKIRILASGNEADRFEDIYYEYRQLQKLYEIIRANPVLSKNVKATDYSEYLLTYKNKTADVNFERGVAEMRHDNKQGYRNAYYAFDKALRFRPDDTNIQSSKMKAYEAAVVKVMILPVETYVGGYGYQRSSYQFRNFEQELIRNLRHNFSNEFVKFYSEWDARGENIEPDEIMEVRMGRVEMGRPYDRTETRNVSKEVVVKEIVYKPDSVVKQFAKVYAQITTTMRTTVSMGELYVTARDKKGRILWSDVFRGEHKWETQFVSYTGDQRALDGSERINNNRYDNNQVPREEDVYEHILREMQRDMNYRLRNYYNRY